MLIILELIFPTLVVIDLKLPRLDWTPVLGPKVLEVGTREGCKVVSFWGSLGRVVAVRVHGVGQDGGAVHVPNVGIVCYSL